MVSPEVAGTTIERSGLAIEEFVADEGPEVGVSVEAIYEGIIEFTGDVPDFSPLGGWVASTLVRLADLNLEFLPPRTTKPTELATGTPATHALHARTAADRGEVDEAQADTHGAGLAETRRQRHRRLHAMGHPPR